MLLSSILPVAAGTAIYAFGLLYFVIPNQLMEGGVTGISVLLYYIFQFNTYITTLVLNLPLFVLGWKYLGHRQLLYTIFGTTCLSFWLWLFEHFHLLNQIPPSNDLVLSALYAGVAIGLGLGIVFRFGATTGGVDIIARVLNRKFGWSMGQIILAADVLIIGSSVFYISKERMMYTLITVFVATKVIDYIQDGAYSARAFSIITNHHEQIAQAVTQELNRGVTYIPAVGAYSKEPKMMVYCVVLRFEVRALKKIIKTADPQAFIVIHDAHDVLGEGFKT